MNLKVSKFTLRILLIFLIFIVYYIVLESTLWQEQIRQGAYYNKAIKNQSVRRIRIPAPRGRIISSDHYILADNVPVYNIVFHLNEMRRPGRARSTIKHIINSADKIASLIHRENPLKYDILFFFKRMKHGDLDFIMQTNKKFEKELAKKSSLTKSIAIKYLKKYPKRAYTVFENISMKEYEKIKTIAKKTPGIILTDNQIKNHVVHHPALPLKVFEKLTNKELALVSEMTPEIPGMEITMLPIRRYNYGKTACHLIGYVRKEDPLNAPDKNDYSYYIPDYQGKKGLEKAYDAFIPESKIPITGLRGTPGSSLVIVDFRGFVYNKIGKSIPVKSGHDIVLTLNYEAQTIAEDLMKNYSGAFVLLDASTGSIISMLSSPEYDLTQFIPRLSSKYWNKINTDKKKPLLNRAIAGQYEPGSIIKPVVAYALLSNGMNPSEIIKCTGRSYIGNASIRCAAHYGHGNLDIVEAIEQSCNVFFIEEGRVLGLEKISETMSEFGVGAKTGFPIFEKKGLLPSRAELYYTVGRKWTTFDTALISIGQGRIQVTPLQAALYMAAIANGGKLWRPYILKEVLDEDENKIFINKPYLRKDLKLNKKYLDIIHKGMYEVVHGVKGSGKKGNAKKIVIYGKTGTAEKGSKTNRTKNTWFAGFASKNNKTYSFVVFVENGQSGGRTCAPIAQQFFDAWLSNSNNSTQKK